MCDTITIIPIKNRDGSFTLHLRTPYELNEIIKGLKYMKTQRESTRKSQKTLNPRSLSVVINMEAIDKIS
jgi:hypothetical protein